MKTHTINGVEWTEDQMRAAIAKACGAEWVSNGWSYRYLKMPNQDGGYGPDESSTICDDAYDNLPEYLHDLNAMHEAETALEETQRADYTVKLTEATGDYYMNEGGFDWEGEMFDFVNATALQRAIAFIQALNLKPE